MTSRLRSLAQQHLMLHFTDMAAYAEGDGLPIIERGEGCHVYDVEGRRYIDGLSGLYCVNLGHSHGEAIGEANHSLFRARSASRRNALPKSRKSNRRRSFGRSGARGPSPSRHR